MSSKTENQAPACTVVGVGASAGGLQALRELLAAFDADALVAFIVVQHLDPSRASHLRELLEKHTDLSVVGAEDGVSLEPHTVYVAPPGVEIGVDKHRRLCVSPVDSDTHRLRPIDHLFCSLAAHIAPHTAGIVLTGTGSDGTVGLRKLKQAGGLSIAQTPETAEYDGMPSSAIDSGAASLALDISQMPEALARFAELPNDLLQPVAGEPLTDGTPVEADDDALSRLASVLAETTGFSLTKYKRNTVRRRIARRLVLAGFNDVEAYLSVLEDDPAEQQALIHDLFIGVTEFFRNPEAFSELRDKVIVPLVESAEHGRTLRAWVAGCATGEEAYSLGMLFLEAMEAVPHKKLRLQIFATDVDAEAIEVARRGVFPHSIADRLDEPRRRAFFISESSSLRARPKLRDCISFAVHDLTKDPPFARMDVVSCRNVLIYFRQEAQKRALELFHFALRDGGTLFLGSSESIHRQKQLFATQSTWAKLFCKVGSARPAIRRSRTVSATDLSPPGAISELRNRFGRRSSKSDTSLAQEAVLETRVPPTIVVGADDEILFSHGKLDPYLQFPQGEPRMVLISVIRPELAARVRSAIIRCRKEGQSTLATAILTLDSPCTVEITVSPAEALGEDAVVVTFESTDSQREAPLEAPSPHEETLIDQLERELRATQEDLQHTVAELETANEELLAMHEESTAMNEELQSSNEELEASSEELRSLNEELGTVNGTLREKVDQLEQVNNDLSNFISSTQIATVFLDDDFRIERITPSARELLRIRSEDRGRSVEDIGHELLRNNLLEDAQQVLARLEPSKREIHTADGRWVIRRVLPYRTDKRQVAGVVVTFIEITQLKETAELLSARERQQAVIAKLGLHALEEPGLESFLDQVVREVQQTLDTDLCKILELRPDGSELLLRAGVGWNEGLVGRASVGIGMDSQAGFTLRSSQPVIVKDLSKEKRFSGPRLLHEHGVTSGISCTIRDGEGTYGVIGAHTREERNFTMEDTVFLQAIATVIAAAISRHYSRTQLRLETEVAKAIAVSDGLDELFYQVHAAFDELLGVAVGELWWKADGQQTLTCRFESIHGKPLDEDSVRNFCHGEFRPGEGLVGRVFDNGRSEWLTRLDAPSQFVRVDKADELGLECGLAVPIFVTQEICGVLAFFSTDPLVPDTAFLRGLESMGRAIGEFVRRREVEKERDLEEERYTRIFEQAGVALWEEDFTEVKAEIDQIQSAGVDDLEAHLLQNPDVVDTLIAAIQIADVNAETVRLFGASDKDEMLSSLSQISRPESRDAYVGQFLALARGDTFFASEARMQRIDGEPRDVTFTVRFPTADSQLDRVLVSGMDITRIKRAEEQLREAGRQKDEFLAMLGHELRNPLAAIRTAAETLRLLDEDGRLARIQGILDRQTAHMAKLLDGLIDVSRIVRGKISLEPERVDLAEICRRVLEDRHHRFENRQLDLQVSLPDESAWVEADPVRLTQIVDNLVSNAIKYTEAPGTVALELYTDDTEAVLEVSDTGVGIDDDLLPHVFEPFRQAHQSIDRTAGGLGLGLALVQRLVALHGGHVHAYSEGTDQGARFEVRLPLAPAEKRSEAIHSS